MNIAIGSRAGFSLAGSENFNIYIGNEGLTGENGTIKVGSSFQQACYIAGIVGAVPPATNAREAVTIDITTGQLGNAPVLTPSLRRYKDNIQKIDSEKISDIVSKLDPISFSYKSDALKREELGLVAEDVEHIAPELVIYNKEGKVESVKYDRIPIMLLAALKHQGQDMKAQLHNVKTQLDDQHNRIRAQFNDQHNRMKAQLNSQHNRMEALAAEIEQLKAGRN